jgi:predicted lipid-binding transport protein (Tim44 family)
VSLYVAATLILASAGSGSSSFGGGGGGGGGSSFGGGGSSGGGGVGGGSAWGAGIFLGFFVLVLVIGVIDAARYRKKRRERVRAIELAAAEASDDDAAFDVDLVRTGAAELFKTVQNAWSTNDQATLDRLVGADLMVEWRRRLDDFAAKGWHNVVELQADPVVEYVGLVNRAEDAEDRAVVRIEATLKDYVTGPDGVRIMRTGETDELTGLCEYWTLGKRDRVWTLLSVEQKSEGDHQLDETIIPSPWGDTERLHAEAVAERAADEAAPAGVSPAELADLDFDGEARAAALDLALADGRFDPDLIEASVRRAVAAWAEAVDGSDAALEAVSRPEAVRTLLYPMGENTRLVVRGPQVRRVLIAALDAAAQPPAIRVELEVNGRRYVEDRDTAAVLEGSQSSATTFTMRWTLALEGPPDWPWRLAAADSGAAV